MTKEVSKPVARQLLKERIDSEQSKIKSPYFKNSSDAIRNATVFKKSYERTLPETLPPHVQSEMWRKAKQLKDEFVSGMLSRDELHPVKGFMDNGTMKYVVDEERIRTTRSVERELAWQRRNDNQIREFKNLMRNLNPDDPNAGDIEKFRPRKTGIG